MKKHVKKEKKTKKQKSKLDLDLTAWRGLTWPLFVRKKTAIAVVQEKYNSQSYTIKKNTFYDSMSEYCFRATFGQLILMKIFTIVAITCQILRLKCTKIQLWRGFRPRSHWRSLQRSPDLLAWFKGPMSMGRGVKGKAGEGKGGRGEKQRKGEGKEGEREAGIGEKGK